MKQTVILVESGNLGAEIPVFQKLGLDVIFLTTGIIPCDQKYQEQATKVIYDKNFIHYERIAEEIQNLHFVHSIKTVCSTSDFFMYPVSLICEKYSYPFLSSSAAYIFHHKNEFRQKQKELHYNYPEFHVFDELSDAVQFYNVSTRKKWIFKPVNGNESVAVSLIQSEKELIECYKQLKYLSRYTSSLLYPNFLLEEYIEGDIYSCEFITSNGEVQLLGVTNRLMSNPPYFVELGYTFPIYGSIEQKIIYETNRFVIDFQYDFGPCHIEYIVTPDKGIYILEVNPRLVGPPNPWMIDQALEISIFDHICSLYISGKLSELSALGQKFSTCIEVTSPVSGYLKSLQVDQDYLERNDIHIIFLKEKNQYIKKATSNTDILARILTVADTTREAQKLAKEVYDNIRLEMDVKPLSILLHNEEI
ncbi:ATP-grasp domain-containing protein [Paenibacillus sp. ClWae2A]|uniref:ATP-grasp domain-containing protein n=1 Tax=Paenibacillus sp. ClWae2A TaxID=3057177 RepID=UPI0028F658D5|nr:ATP-grasp domain-containing protein [Paenibacillus sp. ClWae2A]MDT9722453.1 ATP-grasp domain-containing protein [Paenibacillus sp. ClWae2A]